MKYTEKRKGKNVIPLRNAVFGIDLPKWSIHKESDIQSFLSGDAVDRLAELEDKIEQGTLIELPTMLQDKQGDWRVYFYSERYGIIDCYVYDTREETEKRLKELQNG